MDELRSILEANPISELPERGTATCADCFEFSYRYGGYAITLSDVTDPIRELEELDSFLEELPLPADRANGG